MNTKHRKFICGIFFTFLTMLFVLIFMLPAAAKNNIALECEIDSYCGEIDGAYAYMLIDSDIDCETKWETSDGKNHTGDPHWIILDLKEERTFDRIRLTKASQGMADYGRTEFDASGFIFEISSDKTNWYIISEVSGNGDEDIYERSFPPTTARYLKLTITNPEYTEIKENRENQTVRLYDLKIFEYIESLIADDKKKPSVSEKTEPSVYTSDNSGFFCIFIFLSVLSLLVFILQLGKRSLS